ncbi:MAG: hypothetical protein F6K40_00025 [Okeania sp. SIO3I5]|uniref:TauD/TfdA family dioxygenase n=1 Tax=Okeania sp. SIO3I5 TaxID=2607805 RepID=UPI0013BD8461|nr:TauD/TfdA family dioxygenase [Okeania sp. SIO3I5]NEQ34780.1 hypothetical protein [Okeania sp. SIO3I5]
MNKHQVAKNFSNTENTRSLINMKDFLQHQIPAETNQVLQAELSKIPLDLENITEEKLRQLGKVIQQQLPEQILQSLQQLTQPHGLPFLVIHNLPIDEKLGKPPVDGKRPQHKTTDISEKILLGISAASDLLPLAYKQEKGVLVQEITPVPGKERSLSNEGSISLGYHTDESILTRCYRPEFLFLLGLINDSNTPTYIAELNKAFAEISPRHRYLLQQPLFRVELPESFKVWNGKVIQSELRPLVTENQNGELEIAANLYAVKSITKEAKTAVDALSNVLPYVSQAVTLQGGDMLLFDNSKCLHGRAAISQNGDRWLQRLFCRRSLMDIRRATDSNNGFVFDIKFLVLE